MLKFCQFNGLALRRNHPNEGEDYYDKLGVTKIINAAGTYTMFTASIMPPSVQAAVARPRNIQCAWPSCRKKPENISPRN